MGREKAGAEKEAYVESLFSSIAGKYDLLNNVLSMTRHKSWRRYAVSISGLRTGGCALDTCCGTGDFSFDLADKVGTGGTVVGVDFSQPMIELAKEKAEQRGINCISFITGNAGKLPFSDNAFDCVTVGFGIRNLADVSAGLKEMTRVVKPGGKVVCLEISKVTSPILSIPWKLWFYVLTPYTAVLFRGRRSAYEYLPQSVKEFMSREELAAEFEKSGLGNVTSRDLMFGAVCIHIGTKL